MSIGSSEYDVSDMPIPFKRWDAGEPQKCDWCGTLTRWLYQIPDQAPTGESESVCEECARNGHTKDQFDCDYTEEPVCPHCGKPDQDWWDGLEANVGDGSQWTVICGFCEKEYQITVCVLTRFSTAIAKIECGNEM